MCYPKSDEVKRAVNEALRRFYLNDRYLIDHDVNERALTFRLGLYLQQIFTGWDVDCEYNKNCETLRQNKLLSCRCKFKPEFDCVHCTREAKMQCTVFPDIIIHRRGTEHNLLVIEAKKDASDNDRKEDIDKIKAYREEKTLHYRYGLFLDFRSTRNATVDASVFFSKSGRSSLRIKAGSINNEVK